MSSDDVEPKPLAMGLSTAFDSSAATLRLAAMTSSSQEVEAFSRTFKMAVPSGDALKQAALDAAQPRSKAPAAPIFEERRRPKTDISTADQLADNSGNLLLIGIVILILAGLALALIF